MNHATALPISNHLPRDARDALVSAAAIHPSALPGESRERACKLADVIKRIKLQYPQLFNHPYQE
jgi:hypothetical protein